MNHLPEDPFCVKHRAPRTWWGRRRAVRSVMPRACETCRAVRLGL